MAREVVGRMEELKARTGLPQAFLCRGFRVSASSVRRWRRRMQGGFPVLSTPGPKKVLPVDLPALERDISGLGHRRKRSFGAPALVQRHSESISRRDLYGMVRRFRERLKREARASFWRYEWRGVNKEASGSTCITCRTWAAGTSSNRKRETHFPRTRWRLTWKRRLNLMAHRCF
jgi:hypothetical protein